MYFNGDIVITDPMYIVKSEEDWHRCEYGEKLEALDIFTYITAGNGDEFASDIVSLDTHECLGELGSDSCMISVMLLSELRQYNYDFDKDLEKHCYTIIEDFEGEVQLVEMEESDADCQRFYFVGKGNKNFRTDFFE
jgi:predicted RNA-binding protein